MTDGVEAVDRLLRRPISLHQLLSHEHAYATLPVRGEGRTTMQGQVIGLPDARSPHNLKRLLAAARAI